MIKRVVCTLLFLLFASCCIHAAGPDTLVGTYYYPWYDTTYFNGHYPSGDNTLVYHLDPQVIPALGWYNQKNAGVINQHYGWAEYAGIDFFVCSYWGINSRTDNIIRNYMFNNPDRGNIKLCVFLEPSITPQGGATEAEITAETNYLCDNYFNQPGYFHIDGKPVIFIYLTRAMTDAGQEMCINTIRTIASQKGIDVYIAGDEVWGAPNTNIDGPRVSRLDAITNYDVYGNNGGNSFVTDSKLDTWQSRNAMWKDLGDDYGTDFIPAISPGYNDRGVRIESDHAACSRKLNNESNEFGTLFTGMIDRLETNVNMVMINSWNEWHEDTQIEPTTVSAPTNADDAGGLYTEGVYYEGYGMRYLDILREYFVSKEIAIGVSAAGENATEGESADKAFDGDVNTKWLDFAPSGSYIQYRYAGGVRSYITEYAITSANDSPERDPMDWNLLGSNDGGITWDLLDSITGATFASRFETQSYTVSNPDSYNSYRLEITAVNDLAAANSVQLAEIQLLTCFGLADLNCDGIVDVGDLSYMAGVWLTSDSTADITQPVDGLVNLLDLSILSQQWLGNDAVAYWAFNDTSGSVALDSSESGYNGTLVNMDDSDWVDGVSGNALEFDGIDDYVQIAGYEGVTGIASRTSMAWIKTTVGGDILGYGNGAGTGTKWRFRVLSTGVLAVQVNGYAQTTSATVNDGDWHHVAVVLPAKSTPLIDDLELYIDGNKITDITTGSGSEPINTGADNTVKIGVYEYAGSGLDYFDGLIDEVRIYDRALSDSEIMEIAQ